MIDRSAGAFGLLHISQFASASSSSPIHFQVQLLCPSPRLTARPYPDVRLEYFHSMQDGYLKLRSPSSATRSGTLWYPQSDVLDECELSPFLRFSNPALITSTRFRRIRMPSKFSSCSFASSALPSPSFSNVDAVSRLLEKRNRS